MRKNENESMSKILKWKEKKWEENSSNNNNKRGTHCIELWMTQKDIRALESVISIW